WIGRRETSCTTVTLPLTGATNGPSRSSTGCVPSADLSSMLIQGIWYFPLLAAMVATYWHLPHRATLRLGFLSSMSCVVLAYLLWRNLDNRIVLAFIGI